MTRGIEKEEQKQIVSIAQLWGKTLSQWHLCVAREWTLKGLFSHGVKRSLNYQPILNPLSLRWCNAASWARASIHEELRSKGGAVSKQFGHFLGRCVLNISCFGLFILYVPCTVLDLTTCTDFSGFSKFPGLKKQFSLLDQHRIFY